MTPTVKSKILDFLKSNSASDQPLTVAEKCRASGWRPSYVFRIAKAAGISTYVAAVAPAVGKIKPVGNPRWHKDPVVVLGIRVLRAAKLDGATRLRYEATPGRLVLTAE